MAAVMKKLIRIGIITFLTFITLAVVGTLLFLAWSKGECGTWASDWVPCGYWNQVWYFMPSSLITAFIGWAIVTLIASPSLMLADKRKAKPKDEIAEVKELLE